MKLSTTSTSVSSLLYLSSLLVLVYLRIEGCIGFILLRTHGCKNTNVVVGASLSQRRRSSSTDRQQQHDNNNLVVLNGYAQVNDYFSSFNNNSNESENDDEDSSQEISSGHHDHDIVGQPPSSNNKVQDDDDANESPTNHMTYEQIVAYNNARLCPKLLLTQCAIQSFIHLLEECRDPHSGKWIEDYLELQNLGNYHGTGALNITTYPTWDAPLHSILQQPNTKMIVSAKRRGRGHGGWSKNNPYLQDRYVEYSIDIRPASLVQRLLGVRNQLANEFENDLDIVRIVDGMIMKSYFRRLKEQQQYDNDVLEGEEAEESTSSSSSSTTPSFAFDRISDDILTNFTEYQSLGSNSCTPFRRGNFDLLYSLCTQAASHRLLRELQQSSSSSSSSKYDTTNNNNNDNATYQWFKKFYIDNVPKYFDGDQKFGRADEYLTALLNTPPSLVEISSSSLSSDYDYGLIDPLQITQRIITIRSTIANEWQGMMREVTYDHSILNDVLFRVMMGRSLDESENVNDSVVEIQEEIILDDLDDSAGEFE